jgi:hypothetical protein
VVRPTEGDGWRFVLAGLIAFVLFVVLIAVAHGEGAYVPLTIEQAKAYMAVNPEGAAEDIVKLDAIEHQAPRVEVPVELFVLAGQALRWNWQGPLVITLAGDPATVYHVDLQGGEQRSFAPPSEHAQVVFWEIVSAAALVGGALLGRATR